MRIRTFSVTASAALAVLLAGCATTRDPGWQGRGATPFDAAQVECRAEAAVSPESHREARFTACMARHGWTRGGGRGD
jgi:hypothetical protein